MSSLPEVIGLEPTWFEPFSKLFSPECANTFPFNIFEVDLIKPFCPKRVGTIDVTTAYLEPFPFNILVELTEVVFCPRRVSVVGVVTVYLRSFSFNISLLLCSKVRVGVLGDSTT
jgi:hypothetical protein